MRLLTHNLLMCNVKGCNTSPLIINATKTEKTESEFNPEFIKHMLSRLQWSMLASACKDLQLELPAELPPNAHQDNDFLKKLHDVLNDFNIVDGSLVCPKCNRSFPVSNGVPRMILNEDEV